MPVRDAPIESRLGVGVESRRGVLDAEASGIYIVVLITWRSRHALGTDWNQSQGYESGLYRDRFDAWNEFLGEEPAPWPRNESGTLLAWCGCVLNQPFPHFNEPYWYYPVPAGNELPNQIDTVHVGTQRHIDFPFLPAPTLENAVDAFDVARAGIGNPTGTPVFILLDVNQNSIFWDSNSSGEFASPTVFELFTSWIEENHPGGYAIRPWGFSTGKMWLGRLHQYAEDYYEPIP